MCRYNVQTIGYPPKIQFNVSKELMLKMLDDFLAVDSMDEVIRIIKIKTV